MSLPTYHGQAGTEYLSGALTIRKPEAMRGRGDVLYHLGHSCNYQTSNGRALQVVIVLQSQPFGIRKRGGDWTLPGETGSDW